MARNHVRNSNPDSEPTEGTAAESATIPGGALGIIPEAKTTVGLQVQPAKDPFERRDAPLAKKFRVVNGGSVMYDGCRVPIRAGKEVSDRDYNLPLLRRQGIILEEILEN